MKKGLLNLILLVLVITNVALTAILVFAIVSAMNATSDLVNKVAQAIDLEKELKDQASDTISIDQTESFTFTDKFSIELKASADGSRNFAQFQIILTLDKEDENYKKYKDQLKDKEQVMRSVISNVVAGHTAEELAQSNIPNVSLEVRKALRDMFNETEFIYSVNFSEIVTLPR